MFGVVYFMMELKKQKYIDNLPKNACIHGSSSISENADVSPALNKNQCDENHYHKGWHSRGYLPHFDTPKIIQVVTFRLFDSLPVQITQALKFDFKFKAESEKRKFIDSNLDAGYGACYMNNPIIAEIVENSLMYFHDQRYLLYAWIIMPNHVHAMVEIFENHPLSNIIHSWKSYTAHKLNKLLNRTGTFWQEEYWDRFIRSEEHFYKALEYIHNNPVKAGLVTSQKDWKYSSIKYKGFYSRD